MSTEGQAAQRLAVEQLEEDALRVLTWRRASGVERCGSRGWAGQRRKRGADCSKPGEYVHLGTKEQSVQFYSYVSYCPTSHFSLITAGELTRAIYTMWVHRPSVKNRTW